MTRNLGTLLGLFLLGAPLPCLADKGDDLLDAVIGNDNPKAVELVHQGADVNKTQPNGWTPLLFALYNRNSELSQLLIEKGADVNAREWRTGNTALMLAASWGNVPLVQLLIQKGAQINAQQRAGNTALSYAVSYQHDDVVQLLKKAGAL